jgi:hypothetical protein
MTVGRREAVVHEPRLQTTDFRLQESVRPQSDVGMHPNVL